MPPHYEEAAHMLYFMTQAGLLLKPGVDCRAVLTHIGQKLKTERATLRKLSHYGAATALLTDLERKGFVACPDDERERMLSLLGTLLANFLAAHAARPSASMKQR